MAIYKSSFNKKPDKKESEKQEKEKQIVVKEKKVKAKRKVNAPLISLIVFSVIFLICILPSNFIKNFILGVIGLLVYPICVIGILVSALFMKKKRFSFSPNKRYIIYLSIALFIIWFIFHLILTSRLPMNGYGEFLRETYLARTTAGGILFSLISYPIVKLLTLVGAYVFSAIALAIIVGLIIDFINTERNSNKAEKKSKFDFNSIEDFELEEPEIKPVSKEEQAKKIAKRRLGLEKGETTILSSSMPNLDINSRESQSRPMSKREYILTPIEPVIPPENTDDLFLDNSTGYFNSKKVNKKSNFNDTLSSNNVLDSATIPQANTREEEKPSQIEEIKPVEDIKILDTERETREEDSHVDTISTDVYDEQNSQADNEYKDIILDDEDEYQDYDYMSSEENDSGEEIEEDDLSSLENLDEAEDNDLRDTNIAEEITPDLNQKDFVDNYSKPKEEFSLGSTVETEVVRPSVDLSKFNLPNVSKKLDDEPEQMKIEEPKVKQEIPPYVTPPVELLNYIDNPSRITDEELQDNIDRLEQVLEDFKVPAKVNNVKVGPAVTRYELTMPRGISVNKIAQMADDIAMTLASNGAIRVEAPIPGKNSVGIEVPNAQVSAVSLRELIDSNEFRVRGNPLSFVLGKDINGDIIFCNLDKMPHLLVAGSTGSGKSVCLNTMLLSMCYKSGPQDLRLILVDPKMVEFSTYNGLPHLLIPEVITNKDMTINALDWAIKEMERRYALFAKNHVVNINEFNKLDAVKSKREEKLPFIVIVVDELADLMLEAKREIEDRIAKLAAKARAAGIHLVLATQRPSVDVITGTVKANLPSRIAFALTNYMDSKTVLDGGGAEKLLGKGDMLFKPQDKPEPRRVQGAFVSNAEISKVVEFIKTHNRPVYDDATGNAIKNPHQEKSHSHEGGAMRDQEFDPVLKEALRMFIQTKQASGSMISRRYSVGFNRAGRIMDQMERAGFIGPQEGSKPRQVLITMDEYKAIFGDDE